MGIIGIEGIKARYLDEMKTAVGLSDDECAAIESLNSFREFKKGTVLLKEGQFSSTSYSLVKGCLKSYFIIDGEEQITGFYTENEIYTPTCVFTNEPSKQFLSCVEDCLVIISNPEIERVMLERFPRFEKLCRVHAEELLAKQKADFDDFKTASPEQRYLNLLNNRPDLLQRIPQYQIASYLCLTPQSLSRIRRRLLKSERTEKELLFSA